jgi:hypothetical protein
VTTIETLQHHYDTAAETITSELQKPENSILSVSDLDPINSESHYYAILFHAKYIRYMSIYKTFMIVKISFDLHLTHLKLHQRVLVND